MAWVLWICGWVSQKEECWNLYATHPFAIAFGGAWNMLPKTGKSRMTLVELVARTLAVSRNGCADEWDACREDALLVIETCRAHFKAMPDADAIELASPDSGGH